MIRRLFVSVLLALSLLSVQGQNIPLHPEAIFPHESELVNRKGGHTSILPYQTDIRDSSLLINTLHTEKGKSFIAFTPILSSLYRFSGNHPGTHLASGVRTFGKLTNLLSFEARYSLHYFSLDSSYFPGYLREGKVISHYGRYSKANGNNYLLQDFTFAVTLHPMKYIDVEAGIGKHHIGDGYRSLFLSTNAASYPYLKTSLHFWNVYYFSMVTSMNDYLIKKGFDTKYKKYVSLHYLSWNVTKRINLNLFEAVIWERADTLSKRSLDINYLNPVLFFRPVEYNLGSPDNVLMGAGTRILFSKHIMLYGQFLLDEFNLKYIKTGKKWWGDKYGYQVGIKIFDPFDIKPLTLQLEYNQVRPYTYSHNYQLQNYGNWLQPLAHPLGSNFREMAGIVRYGLGKWSIHARSINSFKGIGASANENVGGDIYQSSATRGSDFNNLILQGAKSNVFLQEIKLSRTIVPSWNLQAEVTGAYRIRQTNTTQKDFFITIGFRTLIFEENNLL
jgi:hypothetical protein